MNQLNPHTPSAVQHIIKQAQNLVANKNIDEAIVLLEEAERNHPDSLDISYLLGKVITEEKSPLEGIEKLKATLERFPNHVNSLLAIGNAYLKPGYTRHANPFFRQALEIAPNAPNCHIGIGNLNLRKADLPLAIDHYRTALELQLKKNTTTETPEKAPDFDIRGAEKLLWSTLQLLADNGIHAFMAFGSLLGLERHGEFLLHDKDVDVGLPYSEMHRAIKILLNNGWSEIHNSFGYMSPRSFVHTETKFGLDLFGFVVDEQTKKALCIGIGIEGVPKEWNILWEFDQIELKKRTTPDGKGQVWALKDPVAWLDTLYGDWRTPDKNFDTLISAKNLRSFSLLAKCFAYPRIYQNWAENNIPRALALTRATLERDPNDALLKRVLSRLEARRKEIMNG